MLLNINSVPVFEEDITLYYKNKEELDKIEKEEAKKKIETMEIEII